MNEENRKLREQIEQERRDHELALRLARESKGGMKLNPEENHKGDANFAYSSLQYFKDKCNVFCKRKTREHLLHTFSGVIL